MSTHIHRSTQVRINRQDESLNQEVITIERDGIEVDLGLFVEGCFARSGVV
jgi:hypothetical protein